MLGWRNGCQEVVAASTKSNSELSLSSSRLQGVLHEIAPILKLTPLLKHVFEHSKLRKEKLLARYVNKKTSTIAVSGSITH